MPGITANCSQLLCLYQTLSHMDVGRSSAPHTVPVQRGCRAGELGHAVGRCRIQLFLLLAVIIIHPKRINSPSPSLTKDAFPWLPLPVPGFPPHMHLAY